VKLEPVDSKEIPKTVANQHPASFTMSDCHEDRSDREYPGSLTCERRQLKTIGETISW